MTHRTLTQQDYKHLLDPAQYRNGVGEIVALCGYTWPDEPSDISTPDAIRRLWAMPTCEICSVIVHTLVSGGATHA